MKSWLILGGIALGLYLLHQRQERKRQLPTRRNPHHMRGRKGANAELAAAERISEEFHGNRGYVIELEKRERRMPKYAVAMGNLDEMTYAPGRGSKRGGSRWLHESGDRGWLRKRARGKPLLAVDPVTRKPILVQHHSPMRMSASAGLVG